MNVRLVTEIVAVAIFIRAMCEIILDVGPIGKSPTLLVRIANHPGATFVGVLCIVYIIFQSLRVTYKNTTRKP